MGKLIVYVPARSAGSVGFIVKLVCPSSLVTLTDKGFVNGGRPLKFSFIAEVPSNTEVTC